MYVVFDTETTGLAPKGANWETDYEEFPHIVQLSWKRSDQEEVNDFIIKPDGYEIPKPASDIHGITTEKAIREGVCFDQLINTFINDVLIADKVIGHNIYFDTSNLKANVLRFIKRGLLDNSDIDSISQGLDKSKRVDTMMKTISYCGIPREYGGGYKFPKLTELYKKLFNKEFDAHNSRNDVLATERCYLGLVKRKLL